jgi:hypothetical protein
MSGVEGYAALAAFLAGVGALEDDRHLIDRAA